MSSSSSSSSITRKRKFSTMVSCTSRSSGLEYTTVRNKARKRDDDDYISRLPDVVLADILSLLPSTKEAVATSILSKRWRHVYTCVTRLHFDDSPVADCVRLPHMKSSFPFFTNFIDKVLLQASSHSNNDLTSFSLHFGKAHIDYYLRTRCTLACHPEVAPLRFDTWMSYPLTHRVRELDIYAHVRTPFNLPSALFTCPSLEVCKLDTNLHFQLPSSLCLPNLKELHLTLFSFPNDDSLTRLVSSCPSLEHLNLSSSFESLLTILFSSPSLRRLSILLPTGVEHQRSKYILNVPNLEYLFCHELLALDGHGQLNALAEAQVSTFPMLHGKDFENMPDILSSLSNVECLFLMFGLLEALNFCDIKHKLSMFRNLKHLKLGCEDYLPLNTVLMELLRCAPLLETLTFPTGIAPFSEDDEDYEEMSERECQFWSTNDTVPSCVRSHLKRIVIMNFEGTKWELEIIKYFLKNTPVLEELAVSCSSSVPLADKLLLKSSLQELSRSSMTCSIKVD